VSDYGHGGSWALIRAESDEQIRRLYPELHVVKERPPWMTDEIFAKLEALETDIDRPAYLLEAILQEREKLRDR
jgi:hypothetical protein